MHWTKKDRELLEGMKIRVEPLPRIPAADRPPHPDSIGEQNIEVEYVTDFDGTRLAVLPARQLQMLLRANADLESMTRRQRNHSAWRNLQVSGWLLAGVLALVLVVCLRAGVRP